MQQMTLQLIFYGHNYTCKMLIKSTTGDNPKTISSSLTKTSNKLERLSHSILSSAGLYLLVTPEPHF
jgi:hypothetical protein